MGENVPEMRRIGDVNVALVPMNLPLDGTRPAAVAECLKTFRPQVVCLAHHDNATTRWLADRTPPRPDDQREVDGTNRAPRGALEGEPTEVRARDWHAH